MFDPQTAEAVSESDPGSAGRRPASGEPLKPVLIVLHQQHSTPGAVGQLLVARGHRLDVRRPRFDDPLPDTLADHAGAVIFGGPMSANDPDDFIKRETDWIGVALKERKPFLGICLGAQMMARHLGARVYLDTEAVVEIGYHEIEQANSSCCFGPWPRRVYQWHREGFDLPHGASQLAAREGPFENQAMCYGGTAVGVQFHPEITYAMVHRWSGHNPHRLTQRGAQDRPSQLADHIAHGPLVRRWLDAFLGRWLAAAV